MWVANYDDDSQLLECDGETDHAFADIDLDRLTFFALVPRHASDNPESEVHYVFKQSEGQTLIFFRRRQWEIAVSPGDAKPSPWQTLHVLGFKALVESVSIKVYQYILPNGSTLLSTDYAAL